MSRLILFCLFLMNLCSSSAQTPPDSIFKPSGNFWISSFGDFYYKGHADAMNRGINQYSNIEQGRNAFQIRRIYLGYNYNTHSKFSAELLLAAEDNVANSSGLISGDLLTNNKLAFFIKLANLRWKNIWKGTDLVVGQVATPAFVMIVDPIWSYRPVERTLADRRRVSSYDLGATLQGKLDPGKGNFGYDIMVSNGSAARPETDRFKWFSIDLYAKLLNQKLVMQLYADYQRFNWNSSFRNSGSMLKGFVGYTTPLFTVGVESFLYHGLNNFVGVNTNKVDTLSGNALAYSVFVRGAIIRNKLNYFLRRDHFNPNVNYNGQLYSQYESFNTSYEPNNKEIFFTAGIDFSPAKDIHFIPNVWYNHYKSQRNRIAGSANSDYDLVYRITFSYTYGR